MHYGSGKAINLYFLYLYIDPILSAPDLVYLRFYLPPILAYFFARFCQPNIYTYFN